MKFYEDISISLAIIVSRDRSFLVHPNAPTARGPFSEEWTLMAALECLETASAFEPWSPLLGEPVVFLVLNFFCVPPASLPFATLAILGNYTYNTNIGSSIPTLSKGIRMQVFVMHVRLSSSMSAQEGQQNSSSLAKIASTCFWLNINFLKLCFLPS